MTHKQFLKQLNEMDTAEARIALMDTDKWCFIAFLRLLKDYKDRELVYEVLLTKSHKIIGKVMQVDWAYEFIQWCKDNNKLSILRWQVNAIKKHLNLEKAIAILCPERPDIIKIFTEQAAVNFINEIINEEPWQKALTKTVKAYANGEIWYLGYIKRYPNSSYTHRQYININNDVFAETFDINNYKMNPKSLFLFLIKGNKFNKEQINDILKHLKNSLTYDRTNINDFPFDMLKKEYYDYIKTSIMIKELQK